MQLDTDHLLPIRAIANRRRYRGAFLGFLIMGLAVTASAQDDAPRSEDSASQAVAAENAEGGETSKASESAGETGEEKTLESPEAAESAVQEAAEDAKEITAEAVDALKSGDLTTAAEKSGELFNRYGIPAITVLVVLIVAFFVASFLARICSASVEKGCRRNIRQVRWQACFLLSHGERIAGCAAVLWDWHRQLCGGDCGRGFRNRLGVSRHALEFLCRCHVVGIPPFQSR